MKQDSASGVNPVKLDSTSGVKQPKAAETPTSTSETVRGVKQDSASPLKGVAPLNKETGETPGGGPEESAAHEGRPPEPPPHVLTSNPTTNQYIRDQWAARAKHEPTPLEKQMAILEARWAAQRGKA